MQTVNLALPAPHAGQQRVIDGMKRMVVISAGVRWGKTRLAIDRLVRRALAGVPCAWVSPSYKNLSTVFKELKDLLSPVTANSSEQEHRIDLIVEGGLIECWSMENIDNMRGRRYGLVVIDEAAHCPNLEAAWTQVIRPRLTDLRGDALIISTPKGASNYFARLFARGADPEFPNWASWRVPTSDNPLIDPAEIEEARADLSELAFRQEYLAEFVSWTGAVFRKIENAITTDIPLGPEPGRSYFMGCDWGKSDFCAFAVVDDRGKLVELDRFRGLDYGVARGRLAALRQKWRNAYTVAEANAMGTPIIEDLHRSGIPVQAFNMSNASKAEIVEGLSLAFEQGRVQIPNDPVLIAELASFESSKTPSGMTKYAAGGSGHDDCVVALCIAMAASGGGMRPEETVIIVSDDYETLKAIGRLDLYIEPPSRRIC